MGIKPNTHFKADVKDKPCHGLNASYGDRPLACFIGLKNGI